MLIFAAFLHFFF